MTHPPIARRLWIGPTLLLALVLIAPSVPGQATSPPRKIPEALNFANGLYRKRQYDLAAEEYEKFLQANQPRTEADDADARFGLGNARLFLGQYKEAREAFENFVKATPEHPNAPTGRYRIGEASYVLGDLEAARRSLEEYAADGRGDRRYLPAAWSHLGEVDVRLNDLPAARKAYENALAGNPQGSLASRSRLGLGRVLDKQGEPESALRVLRDLAGQGGPEWSDKAWLEVGRIEGAQGRWKEAAEALVSLETATPRSPLLAEARIDRAEALGKLGRPEDAEAVLRAVAEDPSNPLAGQAAEALGSSLLARGKAADALAVLDQAASRVASASSPTASALRYRAAEASLALGKVNDARNRFLKLATDDPKAPSADDALLRAAAMTLDGKDASTARRLAALFASKFPDSPLRGDVRLLDARAALALGQFKDAIATLEASIAEDHPGPLVAQAITYYLGLAYQADGQPAKAIPPLEKYLAEKPRGEVADHALARIAQAQSDLDRPDEAEATLARLARDFPDSATLPAIRSRLAEAALAAKRYDRSAELFQTASESPDPAQKARARSGLGWSLLRGGHPSEAAAAFAALLASSPDDPLAPEAALARGFALDQAKQPEDARSAYAQAVEKYPKSPQAGPAALALARLQVESKKPEDASKTFALIVKDYEKTAGEPLDTLLSEWGWALIDAGNSAEADATFGRLLKEFPDSPRVADARYNLAVSAFAAKDHDRAIELLKPVVAEGSKTRPQLARPALMLYGRSQVERLDWPGASATFARLISEGPDAPDLREARFWSAEVAFKSGDVKKAEPEFAALAAEPSRDSDFAGLATTAKARRVQCLAQLARWEDTLPAADTFLVSDPTDPLAPEVEYSRGRACQGLARFEEARESFDRVIAARKGGDLAARAQLMRGETYFHQQKYKDALRDYYRVILQYDAPEWQALALLEAGKVHEKLDQWKDAVESYEQLRARFPGDRNVDEAGRRLEAARGRIARPIGSDDAKTR